MRRRAPSTRPEAPGPVNADAKIADLLHRAVRLDPSPHVISGSDEGLRTQVANPLAAIVTEAIDVATHLESELETPAGAEDDAELDRAFDLMGDERQAASIRPPSMHADVLRLCFAVRHELGPVRDQLTSAAASHDQRLVACDRARRKLRRSLVGLGEALARSAGRAFTVEDELNDNVQVAVAVRYLYVKFREALPECAEDAGTDEVTRALRRAATALAMLLGDDDFGEVRVADQMLLKSLQRRTLAWGRNPDRREGLRLYGDIRSAAELLRAINLRQELQAHDTQLLVQLQDELGRGEDADPAGLQRLAGRMRALRGLDDGLDDLLRRAYGGQPLPTLLPRLRQEIDRLVNLRTRADAFSVESFET